jgi:hypothetical protein
LALALCGFVLLTVWRLPPLVIVVFSALAGMALAVAWRAGDGQAEHRDRFFSGGLRRGYCLPLLVPAHNRAGDAIAD